ncbi:MAG: DUF3883 domain-containing protein [Campylobacterales bacterium]
MLITCDNNNEILDEVLNTLPYNQGGIGRHKCVICAYAKGLQDGKSNIDSICNSNLEICIHGNSAPTERISNIHDNQNTKQGRHKCAICSYSIGFDQGIKVLSKLARDNCINLGTLKLSNKQKKGSSKKNINQEGSKKKVKLNYIKEQMFKKELGLLGEKLVCKYEEEQGSSVQHKSLEDDSLGYDIEVFDGANIKYIEVKTTIGDINTGFYLSKNELEFLKKHSSDSYIYRLYNYNFTSHSADFFIIAANDFLDSYILNCQSYAVMQKGN